MTHHRNDDQAADPAQLRKPDRGRNSFTAGSDNTTAPCTAKLGRSRRNICREALLRWSIADGGRLIR